MNIAAPTGRTLTFSLLLVLTVPTQQPILVYLLFAYGCLTQNLNRHKYAVDLDIWIGIHHYICVAGRPWYAFVKCIDFTLVHDGMATLKSLSTVCILTVEAC